MKYYYGYNSNRKRHQLPVETITQSLREAASKTNVLHIAIQNLNRASGKTVAIDSQIKSSHLQTITNWVAAFEILRKYPHAATILKSEVDQIVVGEPERSEDAAWRGDGILWLGLTGAGSSPTQMLHGLVHEIGHAFADKLGFGDIVPEIYGKPPFVCNYAATNAFEDFAETYLYYHVENDMLRNTCPDKYADMGSRISD